MKIAPTLQKGIRIDVESLIDWARLELIPIDAARLESDLAHVLASKMEIEGDWEDYVLPDITEQLSEQLKEVHREIRFARSEDGLEGELHISRRNVGSWYGALNQARLALESQYNLSEHDELDEEAFDKLDYELKGALARSHFYLSVQSMLLEYVMIG